MADEEKKVNETATTYVEPESHRLPKKRGNKFGILAAVAGTAFAMFLPVSDFEEFLYFIGSVFAPMATLLCVDYFVLHRNCSADGIDWRNIVLWTGGFVLYRFSLAWDVPCGNTLPVMVVIALVAIVVDKLVGRVRGLRE